MLDLMLDPIGPGYSFLAMTARRGAGATTVPRRSAFSLLDVSEADGDVAAGFGADLTDDAKRCPGRPEFHRSGVGIGCLTGKDRQIRTWREPCACNLTRLDNEIAFRESDANRPGSGVLEVELRLAAFFPQKGAGRAEHDSDEDEKHFW
jgi:hypothetical protein